MSIQMIPKLLLWMLLTLSALGTVSSLLKPNMEPAAIMANHTLEQQMAISTATNFAREWMAWNGDESVEDRQSRLRPYSNPSVLNRLSQIKAATKGKQQKVNSAEFVSLVQKGAHLYAVHIRVVAMNPARTLWNIEVPVAVQLSKGSRVVDSPIIRPLSEAKNLAVPAVNEPTASNEVKQRMKSTIESFVQTFCEGRDTESLVNYVSTGTTFVPLQGRLKLLSIDELLVFGSGPYIVSVRFSAQDGVTGFSFTQGWTLRVMEENQKFFVSAME